MKMSLFGKLKNIGPPAPPRRTGKTEDLRWRRHAGWKDDEEDECDMYEVPPCERPTVSVPTRQVEENLYIERTSSVSVLTPASRPTFKTQRSQPNAKEFTVKKPPEVDRNEKPDRKKMATLPARFLTSTMEEDVYLEPHGESGVDEDLYLEPAAACPPSPPDPTRMSSKTSPSPSLIMKPPVPRANSSSFLHCSTEIKTVPNHDTRPVTTKLSPLTAGFKSPLSTSLKETILRHANPHMPDTKNARRHFPHPTQLSPERPTAFHPRSALPAESLQHSCPLPGRDAGLCTGKGRQEK
ncbi:B-cell linker protein isoform X3 [Corythoichthys intestinalis]|uniref:B-cell linker protein isoform X3 n=1 Tax=Corythoichthys intestinalis TaxID=161448 RepID=UPI0025A58034|nr:B-cell linker protein isoform X3 [Corythoichthys intestinalis]